MSFLECIMWWDFFLRFLPSSSKFEELKYRWRRQEKREGEQQINHRLQLLSSKQDAQKERGRERGFFHARKEHTQMWYRHTQKEKENRWICCAWRRRAHVHSQLLQNLTIHDHQDLFSILCLCSLIKNQNHSFVIVTHTRTHTHVEHMTHMTYPQKLLSLFS